MFSLADRFSLIFRILCFSPERSKPVQHAMTELNLIYGAAQKEGGATPGQLREQAAMNRSLLEVVAVISTQKHTEKSITYAKIILGRLLSLEPILPLTGDSSEWVEISSGVFRNRRCERVIREGVNAYDSAGIVFLSEGTGVPFTTGLSRVPITFPYVPRTTYVTPDGQGFPTHDLARLALRFSVVVPPK